MVVARALAVYGELERLEEEARTLPEEERDALLERVRRSATSGSG